MDKKTMAGMAKMAAAVKMRDMPKPAQMKGASEPSYWDTQRPSFDLTAKQMPDVAMMEQGDEVMMMMRCRVASKSSDDRGGEQHTRVGMEIMSAAHMPMPGEKGHEKGHDKA